MGVGTRHGSSISYAAEGDADPGEWFKLMGWRWVSGVSATPQLLVQDDEGGIIARSEGDQAEFIDGGKLYGQWFRGINVTTMTDGVFDVIQAQVPG
jgi:hypothetical protein